MMAAFLSVSSVAKTVTLEVSSSAYSGGEVENFQALVKLSEGDAYGFSYADCAATDGSDIYFTASDGETVLASEIDTWNAGGDSYIWVKMPSMTPRTKIQMHWGDADAAATAKAGFTGADVWTGCVGVWHMNGTGTASEPDSTGNGLAAVPTKYPNSNNASDAETVDAINTTSGKVAAGRQNTAYHALKIEGYADKFADISTTTFAASGWFCASEYKTTDNDTASCHNLYPWLLAGKKRTTASGGNTWQLYSESFALKFIGAGGTTSPSTNKDVIKDMSWHYLVVSYNGGTSATVYIDGTAYANTLPNAPKLTDSSNNINVFTIGGLRRVNSTKRNDRSFIGTIDEVRLREGAMSADRVKANYKTMSAPTEFLVLSTAPVWNNTADDGALDNPANWSSGSMPESGEEATLVLSGDVTLTTATALAFGTLTVDGAGSAVFPANVTATGLALMADVTATLPGTAGLANGGLSGAGTLVLDPGAGATMTMTKDNTAFSGEVVVKSGTVKFGNRHSFGFGGLTNTDRTKTTAGTARVRVKSGATLDAVIGTVQNWTGWPCTSTVLEDGASLVSSSSYSDPDGVALATPLKLEGDATLSNTGKGFAFGTRTFASNSYGILDIGEYTLTLAGSATTYFNTCATRGDGIIDVTAGTLCLRGGGDVNLDGARPHTTLTNGLVKIRSGVKLQVSKGTQNTAAKIKNLQIDGTGTVDASQSLTVTGFLTGGGSINRVTLASGAAFKPDGTNSFTITDTLTGTLKLDTDDALASTTGSIPLVRVPAAKAESIVFENIPDGWQVKWSDDGDYKASRLSRVGFTIFVK